MIGAFRKKLKPLDHFRNLPTKSPKVRIICRKKKKKYEENEIVNLKASWKFEK